MTARPSRWTPAIATSISGRGETAFPKAYGPVTLASHSRALTLPRRRAADQRHLGAVFRKRGAISNPTSPSSP